LKKFTKKSSKCGGEARIQGCQISAILPEWLVFSKSVPEVGIVKIICSSFKK